MNVTRLNSLVGCDLVITGWSECGPLETTDRLPKKSDVSGLSIINIRYQSISLVWKYKPLSSLHFDFLNPFIFFCFSESNLPLNLLPVPGSVIEIPGSSKVLRRRQLTTTKVINTRSLFLFPPSSRY